ncbi:MAG: hypothetical protein ABI548_14390 [Polyangiaceae bacterium]
MTLQAWYWSLLGFTLGWLSTGCFPFIVPPARISVGAGAALGAVPGSAPHAARNFVALRGGVHPLDVLSNSEQRTFDVALGYQGEVPPEQSTPRVYGPYLELGAYPFNTPVSPGITLKAGLFGSADLLYRSRFPDAGFGATVGGLVELTGRADGAFSSASNDGSVVFGNSAGRWSVGLFASGSRRAFSDGAYNDIVIGASVRVPFAAGIVCCAWPHASNTATHDDDDDDGGRSEHPHRPHAPAEPKRAEPTKPEQNTPTEHIPAQPRLEK